MPREIIDLKSLKLLGFNGSKLDTSEALNDELLRKLYDKGVSLFYVPPKDDVPE